MSHCIYISVLDPENTGRPESLSVAIAADNRLINVFSENSQQQRIKGNLYTATITSIEPSLNAVFVNFGLEKHGFLPFKEIAAAYLKYSGSSETTEETPIQDVLKKGQKLLVQVEKEERGTKGAALTTIVSLAGSFLVLMPNNPRGGGISRRVEGEDRENLKKTLSELPLPEGMSIIVRTSGLGRSAEELRWDLDTLLQQWNAISKAAEGQKGPALIIEENDLATRTLRDYLRDHIDKIVVDNKTSFDHLSNYLDNVRPEFKEKLEFYDGSAPLMVRYGLQDQIESAYRREIRLPSGGAIVIDHTEALVAIDINSARATKAGDIESTALQTNLEAADEIARQMRLRDIGGLIVIDFIDMMLPKNQASVEERMKDALHSDRARTHVSRISRFGLMELSRQRLRSGVGEASQTACPRCSGRGVIRSIESVALTIMLQIEQQANHAMVSQIQLQLPVDIAAFIVNERRRHIALIEERQSVEILVIPNRYFESPHFEIKALESKVDSRSYQLARQATRESYQTDAKVPTAQLRPVLESTPLPLHPSKRPNWLKRLWMKLFSSDGKKKKSTSNHHRNRRGGNHNRRRGGRGNRAGQRRQHNNQQRPDNPNQNQNQGQASSNTQRKSTGNSNNRRRNPNQRRNTSSARPKEES